MYSASFFAWLIPVNLFQYIVCNDFLIFCKADQNSIFHNQFFLCLVRLTGLEPARFPTGT